MKCPNCKLINPPSAMRCDCGYDFPTGTMKTSYVPRDLKEERIQDQTREFWKDRIGVVVTSAVIISIASIVGTIADKPESYHAALATPAIIAATVAWYVIVKRRRH